MTPNDYINKAIHAINTDQPNLAMLYMRRGITEMRRLRKDPWLDVREGIAGFADALSKVSEAFGKAGMSLMRAVAPIAKIYSGYYPEDYALVADNA